MSGLTRETFIETTRKSIEDRLPALIDAHEKAKTAYKAAKERCETLEDHRDVIAGLEATPGMKDPGKSEPAYWFVKEITEDDIIQSTTPKLYHPDPLTNEKRPVLMSYEQTWDSSEGDTWEKQAFILTEHGIHIIKEYARSRRF